MFDHLPSLPVIVAMLAAALTSFSRVFDATRAGWGRLPAWAQTLAPSLLTASGAIVAGLAHVATPTDLVVVVVAGVMLILPGAPSNRSAAPLKIGDPITGTPSMGDVAVASAMASGIAKPATPSVPPVIGLMLGCLLAMMMLGGCGLFAAAAPYLAEAAVVISDAVNSVDAAQALLPSLHLSADEQAKAEALIAKARTFLSAAAAADDGAKDLTSEQLDASLADFRKAWAELAATFAMKRVGAAEGGVGLPVPLAVRRVQK